MKKMSIVKLTALMAFMATAGAQAQPVVTDVTPQSVDVTFTDSAEIIHTLAQNGPFVTGSAAELAHPIVAVGKVTSRTPTTHVAIQWGNAGVNACQGGAALPTTSCQLYNSEGANLVTFKLVNQGGSDLLDAGTTADGWYGKTTHLLNYDIKLDSGVKAEGVYSLTVSASAYEA